MVRKSVKINLLDKHIVANNLRRFAYFKFGSIKKMAEALGMNPVTLHSGYLNSRSLPGSEFLFKLMKEGCNLNWLFTSTGHPEESIGSFGRVAELERENKILRSIVQGQMKTLNRQEANPSREMRFAVNG